MVRNEGFRRATRIAAIAMVAALMAVLVPWEAKPA